MKENTLQNQPKPDVPEKVPDDPCGSFILERVERVNLNNAQNLARPYNRNYPPHLQIKAP